VLKDLKARRVLRVLEGFKVIPVLKDLKVS
jgi:hypothetical protein